MSPFLCPQQHSKMAPNLINVTFTSQTSILRYTPQRNGPIGSGWNLTYTGTSKTRIGVVAVGNDSRRTSFTGAAVEFDWFGTAVYLYGLGEEGKYKISIDGTEEVDIGRGSEQDLLGRVEGLDYGNHTVSLECVEGSEINPLVFRQALATIQVGDSE
jgi:hypothetical protein